MNAGKSGGEKNLFAIEPGMANESDEKGLSNYLLILAAGLLVSSTLMYLLNAEAFYILGMFFMLPLMALALVEGISIRYSRHKSRDLIAGFFYSEAIYTLVLIVVFAVKNEGTDNIFTPILNLAIFICLLIGGLISTVGRK